MEGGLKLFRRGNALLPLAVVAFAGALEDGAGSRGQKIPRGGRSSSLSRIACGATAKRRPERNRFSAIRSCAIAAARAPGRTGAWAAAISSASAGTFSNSNVMTSQAFAKAVSAFASV